MILNLMKQVRVKAILWNLCKNKGTLVDKILRSEGRFKIIDVSILRIP